MASKNPAYNDKAYDGEISIDKANSHVFGATVINHNSYSNPIVDPLMEGDTRNPYINENNLVANYIDAYTAEADLYLEKNNWGGGKTKSLLKKVFVYNQESDIRSALSIILGITDNTHINYDARHLNYLEIETDAYHDMYRRMLDDMYKMGKCMFVHIAAYYGHTRAITELAASTHANGRSEQYHSMMCQNANQETTLFMAARNGHTQVIEFLENQFSCTFSYTGIQSAFKYLHDQFSSAPWDICLDLNKQNKFAERAIDLAVVNGHLSAVKTLINLGADLRVANGDSTLAHFAAYHGHTDIIHFFIERNISIDQVNRFHNAPIHLAAKYGHHQALLALKQGGADVDRENLSGATPLMLALDNNTVLALLNAKANASIRTKLGVALELAQMELSKNNKLNCATEETASSDSCALVWSYDKKIEILKKHLKDYPDGVMSKKTSKLESVSISYAALVKDYIQPVANMALTTIGVVGIGQKLWRGLQGVRPG
jgi:ankyrin repeat protein